MAPTNQGASGGAAQTLLLNAANHGIWSIEKIITD